MTINYLSVLQMGSNGESIHFILGMWTHSVSCRAQLHRIVRTDELTTTQSPFHQRKPSISCFSISSSRPPPGLPTLPYAVDLLLVTRYCVRPSFFVVVAPAQHDTNIRLLSSSSSTALLTFGQSFCPPIH